MKRKQTVLVVVLILVALLVGSCTKEQSSGGAAAASGGEINYMVCGGSPFSVAVMERINEFTEATNIKVNIIEIMYDQVLSKSMLEASAETGAYDVIQINRPSLAAMVEPDLLIPLNGLVKDETLNNLFDVHEEYCTFNGNVYAVPHSVDIRCLYYRTDLFEAAGIEKVPETWEELRQTANVLNDPANGVYGLLIAGAGGAGAWTISDFLVQAGSGIIDENGKAICNNPNGVRALQYVCDLYKDGVLSEGTPNYIWADTRGQFAQGTAAMVIEFNDITPTLEDASTSVVAGKYDLALIPGDQRKATNNGGWLIGIPKGSKNQTQAAALIDWIMSPEIQAFMCTASGTMSACEPAMNILIENGDPSLGKENSASSARWEFYTEVTTTSYEMPRTPKEPELEEVIVQAYTAAFAGSKTPQKALDDAAAQINTIMAR